MRNDENALNPNKHETTMNTGWRESRRRGSPGRGAAGYEGRHLWSPARAVRHRGRATPASGLLLRVHEHRAHPGDGALQRAAARDACLHEHAGARSQGLDRHDAGSWGGLSDNLSVSSWARNKRALQEPLMLTWNGVTESPRGGVAPWNRVTKFRHMIVWRY